MGTDAVSINTVPEYVEKLDIEDQQYLQDILHRRLLDKKTQRHCQPGKTGKGQCAEKYQPARDGKGSSGGSE